MNGPDFVDPSPGGQESSSSLNPSVVLAKALRRAAIGLGLTTAAMHHILGDDRNFVADDLTGEAALDPLSAAGQQALLLVRLYRSLDSLVGHDDDSRRAWMQGHTRGLGGTPDQMILEIDGLEKVVAYLEGMEVKP